MLDRICIFFSLLLLSAALHSNLETKSETVATAVTILTQQQRKGVVGL